VRFDRFAESLLAPLSLASEPVERRVDILYRAGFSGAWWLITAWVLGSTLSLAPQQGHSTSNKPGFAFAIPSS